MFPLHDDNPSSTTPYVTMTLIAICVLAFLWQMSHEPLAQQQIVFALGAIPTTLLQSTERPEAIAVIPEGMTMLTSLFLHGGWMHLIGNMLYLWIFGDNVEDAMGHGRFLVFYLLCGIIAVLAHALPDPGSAIPLVGASGAISGVLGAYLLLYPHARVLVAIPIFIIIQTMRIRAMYVLGFWIVLQVFNSATTSGDDGGGIAFGAHIGGFVAGMLLIPLFKRRGVPLFRQQRSDWR